jgi:transposase
MLPNKPHGVPRVNDRRVLNASFGSCDLGRRGAISRSAYGAYTTAYNCFNRCQRGGVWGRMLNALAVAHGAAVLMIHTSILRVHQHAACRRQSMGRLGWKFNADDAAGWPYSVSEGQRSLTASTANIEDVLALGRRRRIDGRDSQ